MDVNVEIDTDMDMDIDRNMDMDMDMDRDIDMEMDMDMNTDMEIEYMCEKTLGKHENLEFRTRNTVESCKISSYFSFRNSKKIPRNLVPAPREVRNYGSKKFRRNSVPTELRGHPSCVLRGIILDCNVEVYPLGGFFTEKQYVDALLPVLLLEVT
jgi:hypothetical protein